MIDATAVPEPTAGVVAKRIWDAAGRGDAETLLQLYAPDVEWNAVGDHPWARPVRGAEALLEYLAGLAEAVDELRLDLKELYVAPTGAVLRFVLAARHGDTELVGECLQLVEVVGGRAVRITTTAFDRAGNDAFWRGIP